MQYSINLPVQQIQIKVTFSGYGYPTNYVNAIDMNLARNLIRMLIDSTFKPTTPIHCLVSLKSCTEISFGFEK